jgi:hypothetical protein
MKQNIVLTTPSVATLKRAAELAESIERQQNELTALLTGQPVSFTPSAPRARKGKKGTKLSPAEKARISAGLKARWAERKAAAAAASKSPATPVGSPTTVDQTIPAGAESVRMVAPATRAS